MPRVSVIIPAFRAAATLPRCLAALRRQTFSDFETIVIDSGKERSLSEEEGTAHPSLRVLRFGDRLLPHAASNRAVELAEGDLLVLLDADSYPRADWLAKLVETWDARGGVLMGGVECFGDRRIDHGAHFVKFDKWLPDTETRPIADLATVNLLLPRELFDRMGPFLESTIHADTDFGWRLARDGVPMAIVRSAVVEHHHLHTLRSLWRERRLRGETYADLWVSWASPSRARLVERILVSILPLRLLTQTARVVRNAWEARRMRRLLATLPLAITGLYAWLLGEAAGYIMAVRRKG